MKKVFTIYSKWLNWQTSRRIIFRNKELYPVTTYKEPYTGGNINDHRIQGVFELPDECEVKVIREERYNDCRTVDEIVIVLGKEKEKRW